MRPLYLEMTAFGSYAEKTAVPFESLRQGLYLVTGETGAGKTTIFDAIVFALYGEASGSDRTTDMLHCDHVEKSVDTVVSLRFSQGEKVYTVTRRLHFQKKRGTDNQYGEPRPDALLQEPDRAPTEGATRVTARCEELLGLNAQQFRKIIMLAQGEFREFLKADSDKKNEILGKLFDNSAYLYYQNLLDGARNTLRDRRGACQETLKALLETAFPKEERGEEEQLLYLPEHPRLLENLAALCAGEERELADHRRLRDELQTRIDGLNTQKGAAEAVNAQLEELRQLRLHLDALESQEPEVHARQARLHRAERALHTALPAVRRFERADEALNATSAEIEALRIALTEQAAAVVAAQARVDGDAGNRAALIEAGAEMRRIEDQLPRYQELEDQRKARAAAEKAARDAENAKREREETLAALTETLRTLREGLNALENIDAEVIVRENARSKAAETLEGLRGRDGVQASVHAVLRRETALTAERETLRERARQAAEAEQAYHALYQRFLAGQAGLLAEGLRQELSRTEEARCPVCGTRLCREHVPGFAALAQDTPAREDVDSAKENASEMERLRAEQDKRLETLRTELQSQKDSLCARAKALLPDCGGWESLCAEGALTAAIEAADAAEKDAAEALRLSKLRQEERDRIKKELPENERELELLQQQSADFADQAQTRAAEAHAAEAVIEELKKQLSFADKTAAEARKQALGAEQETLNAEIQAHLTALETAKTLLDTSRGSLREKESAVVRQGREQAEALEAMTRSLKAGGFSGPTEVERALPPMGETDGEVWLAAEQKTLSDYASDRKHSRERLELLTAQTRGRAYIDPVALAERLREAGERYATVNAACAALEKRLDDHTAVLKKTREARKSLDDTEAAWRRLDQLASLAVGAAGEGGKLSFDRYVMGAVFREILEMANRRLDVMSGGRYELVHKTGADRRNAKAGLEIEVLDISTGRQRPSGSLSGGEAFFTSLALALGLSDAVQNHAGGKRMDALFIDEGFGTLSEDVLEKALEVLNQLTEGKRLVGIISHVDKLDESIPQKIRVKNSDKGSSLSLELA